MISSSSTSPALLAHVTCPQCFSKFLPEDILWISEHQDLSILDNRVPQGQLRFLPSRFTPQAEAVDPRGMRCHRLACPNCHLEIPRPLLEMEPYFLSVLGSPGSGKSYFLAAMTRQLRRLLPIKFATAFADADATINLRLKKFESDLFANRNPDQLQELRELIGKTQLEGDGYSAVNFGTQSVSYALPFVFTLRLGDQHPHLERRGVGRTICLFDNAGEHFLPGMDSSKAPVTRHLAESRMLFYVFDPLQDSRFRRLDKSLEAGTVDKSHLGSQEGVFGEAATRIRRYAGLSTTQKYPKPVAVVVTKCDRWMHLIYSSIQDRSPIVPWTMTDSEGVAHQTHAVDVGLVDYISNGIRELLISTCAEVVGAVESFSDSVRYIPVSATGWNTDVDSLTGQAVMRPGEAEPFWAEVPFLYALASSSLGLVPKIRNVYEE